MQKAKETLKNLQEVSLFNEEHLLRVLIDNIPDYIYIKDTRSKFVLANQKIIQVYHLKSPEDIIGKSDHDYLPRELADKYFRDEQEIMSSGKPMINQEETAVDEKGDEIYLSTTKIPLKDKNGSVIGLVGVGRNITHLIRAETVLVERSEELENVNKLLEERQDEIQNQAEELLVQTENLTIANREYEKLSVAVSETDNVVIILDMDGNFEWVNKSFTRIYGLTMDQWIEERGNNILSGSFNPYIQDILKKCRRTGESIRYQSEAKNKDGNTIWTQSTLSPVKDENGKIVRLVAIDSDITALKKAQELINAQRTELESQRDQLEKLNKTKDKFFSIIAHDLKNPFHAILGFSDILTSNFTEITDDKKQEYLSLIHDSARFAQDLLENLLNWSRSQSGTIQYSPSTINLYQIVEETKKILSLNLGEKELNFQNMLEEACTIYADRNMIHTVLRNLIINAIKFTPNGGSIKVEAIEYADTTVIKIHDTGVGMSEDVQKKILRFGEFYSTSGTDGEGGTGLGLIICNDFITKHGGELKLESVEGKGTTFTITLEQEENSK
jgi:PAS domain S-box-containing protein